MSRFCGNCGAEVLEDAKVCGQCGVPITKTQTLSSIPGVEYVDPIKKEKIKKISKRIGICIVSICVITLFFSVISNFIGYKGLVRRLMNAYKNYDIEVFSDMASDLYYSIGDDSMLELHFETIISNDLDKFEQIMGRKYKLSYEIIDSYNLSKYEFSELLESLSYYEDFDTSIISEVMVVEVNIRIEGTDKATMTETKEFHLTKEDGEWRILYLY